MTGTSRQHRIRRLDRILVGAAIAGVINFSAVVCATPEPERDDFDTAGSEATAAFGHWRILDVPVEFRINAIHAALLSTGKVLIIAGSGNSAANFEAATFKTLLWNPQTDEFSLIPTPDDMFCAGHAFRPDGKLLIAGGNRRREVAEQDVTRAAGAMTVTNESRDGGSVTLRQGTRFVSPKGIVFTSAEAAAVSPGASVEVWVEAADEGAGSVITTPTRYRINGVPRKVYSTAEKLTMETQRAQGAAFSYVFDPQTERYQRMADMDHGRWYPTLVGLADGNALAVSGLDEFGRALNSHELYQNDTDQWTEVSALNRYFPTYPALFLMADGRLFYSGSHGGYGRSDGAGWLPGIWDLTDNSFRQVDGLRDPHLTETSASVLLPPAQDQRVMVLGGGGVDDSAESTARTDIVDLREAHPHFHPGPDLAGPARHLSAVILPDDTVLTTGGSRDYRGRGDSNNHTARIYDPTTNSFHDAAAPEVGRNYHSEALLLPDGRVVTLGSEIDGEGDNSEPGAFEQRIEIYSPPYLHRHSRPELTDGPTVLQRGGVADFQTPAPSSIATAKLIRPSAVTHTTDVEQRSVTLDIARKDRAISLTVPTQPGLVPSGWYMLFVTDRSNTPSIARWVQVQ
ncbi:MAG: galactose oxidase-like domain-containing protein [Pseudonocardiaceae bacterium]